MPKILKFQRPKSKLQTKPNHQLSLLPEPQPPTEHRSVENPHRDKITPTARAVGVRKPLKEAIDYDKLTPTQQAKWDAGVYGSIELKSRGIYQYYYLRWRDPTTNKYRSTYLAKGWDEAIAKMRNLTGANRSI
jgi:hypothetical protein